MRLDDEGDDAQHPVAMSASETLRKFGACLTPYEKDEITSYTNVYYCGQGCKDKISAPASGPNYGFDTSEGEYIFRPNDHIAYRYEILDELGSGAFGQVLKAIDHVDEQIVAVKLIRNQRKVLQQAVQEIKILEHVNARDPKNLYGIVRMIESFTFRGHTCISYELLGTNLYEYLKEKDFYPMSLSVIRGVAARMLVALTFLGRENIMHCDLKPENILIRGSDPSVVKLVDLGSASFDANNSFMYIQSRFYRAPEVILEQKYTKAIDWWSFGCILCELANGDPVFPGDDEKDQLGCIMEYLGPPPQSFIQASSARRKREFFDEHFQPRLRQTKKGHTREPGSKSLAKFLGVSEDDDFLSFVMQFLQWDPTARVTPREAMRHPWISSEFVFPTKAEDRTTAPSSPKAEATSSTAPADGKDSGDKAVAAASPKAMHGKAAWQSGHDVTADPAHPATTQPTLEPASRVRRSDPLPGEVHRSSGVASVPALAASSDSTSPRATAQSSSGVPRRPTASQRHNGQAFRGRQRRSTEMTEVEMPASSSGSGGGTAGNSGGNSGSEPAARSRTRDFLVPAEGSAQSALASGSAASRDLPRSGETTHAASAPKPGVLSLAALAMPVYRAVGTTAVQSQPQRQRAGANHGVGDTATDSAVSDEANHRIVTTTAFLSPRSNTNSRPGTPSSAEKSSRVLELRRKFEASNSGTAAANGREHLEGSTRSGGGANNSGPRFAHVAGFQPGEKDPSHGSMSTSAKQRSLHEPGLEPEPSTPPRAAVGKAAGGRRKEYSLTIDGTPTPPPLECPLLPERPRAHAKEYVMPSELGNDTMHRGISLLSSSRPQEPGSSFIVGGRHPTRGHVEEDEGRSSGETVMLSSPPFGSLSAASTIGVGGNGVAPRRVTQRLIPAPRDDGVHHTTNTVRARQDRDGVAAAAAAGAGTAAPPAAMAAGVNGRHPPVNGTMRLAPARQPLAQRQRPSIVSTLNDGKGPSSPTGVLPPLKRNSVR